MNKNFRTQLKNLMCEKFNISELHELCFDLDIDSENLVWHNKIEYVMTIIEHCERNNMEDRLVKLCREKRPDENWLDPGENIEQKQQPLLKQPTSATDTTSPKQESVAGHEEKQLSKAIKKISFSEPPSHWEEINNLTGQAKKAEEKGDHEIAAKLYARVAELLQQEKRYARAREFARKSAGHFLEINEKEAAIEQYLFAAEIWMNHTAFATTMVDQDLAEAEKIALAINKYTLQAQVFLLQAQHNILQGDGDSTEKKWQQVETQLLKVHPDIQVELWTELAIQKAMIARVEGKQERVIRLLEDANSRDWPSKYVSKRLELLWSLLFSYSEAGNWQEADHIYENAQELLIDQDKLQKARWRMHYAASLARRGKIKKAHDTYLKALDFFKSEQIPLLQKHHFYQDMLYTLARHGGHDVFLSTMKHGTERLDLMLNALHEDIGHLYVESARRNFLKGKTRSAFTDAEHALMYAWRKGDWSGIAEANEILAFLYHAEQEHISATLAAIGTVQEKKMRQYALELNNLTDPDEIRQLIDRLLQEWPTDADLKDALVALTQCTDIVPPDQLEKVIQRIDDILQKYLTVESDRNPSFPAIQLLRLLAPHLDQPQTEKLIQFSTGGLDTKKPVSWNIKSEFIKLLDACFSNGTVIQAKFHEQAATVVLAYHDKEAFQAEVEFTLLSIAIQAPAQVRDKIVAFFRERSSWEYLALLNEDIPEETIKLRIESILRAITPHWKDGGIGYSAIQARSINSFNEYITSPSLRTMVIDGLLEVVKNPDGFLSHKSDAILTLRWLPETVLREKFVEISRVLLEVADGAYIPPKNEPFLSWFGNEEVFRRNSLYTLGHLYPLVNNPLKKQIHDRLLSLSRHPSATIRMGTAMALRTLEGSYPFSAALKFTLIELLQDEDPGVRHWAASAAGHRIADGKIPKKMAEFIMQRLLKAAEDEPNANARAGIAYGLRILSESNNLDQPWRDQVQQARDKLLKDVNYKVVRLASGPK